MCHTFLSFFPGIFISKFNSICGWMVDLQMAFRELITFFLGYQLHNSSTDKIMKSIQFLHILPYIFKIFKSPRKPGNNWFNCQFICLPGVEMFKSPWKPENNLLNRNKHVLKSCNLALTLAEAKQNKTKQIMAIRVSVQGVKSLGGHFACLCRGFDFYEVKFF